MRGIGGGFDAEADRRPLDPKLIGRLLRYAAPYKKQILFGFLSLLVVSAAQLAQPLIMREAIDGYISQGRLDRLWLVAALFLGTFVISWVFGYWQAYFTTWAGQKALYALRQQLFDHLQSQSLRFFDKRKTGELMSRVTNDINSMSELISSIFVTVLNDVVVLLGIILLMFWLDPILAFVCLLTLPLMWFVALGFRRRMLTAFRKVRAATGEVNANLQESISGIKVTQSFRREERNLSRFSATNQAQMQANVQAVDVWARFLPVVELMSAIGTAAVLGLGGYRTAMGVMTVGTLVAFLSYVNRFFQPIRALSQIYNQVQAAAAASERIFEILDTPPDVVDPVSPRPLPPIEEGIRFEGVHFAYNPNEPVLHGIDLEIPRGRTVALVGATGAGKTSIINLVCRFYDPTAGTIRVDGRDLKEIGLADWRSRIGMVPQDTFLFSTTIRENIRYGRPDATDEQIEAVVEALGAQGFVSKLPDGLDTDVRERGQLLSQGERQLIAFARALVAEPELLILDEATANIDVQTERLIQSALGTLLAERTAIVIAHRLSTVRRADRIVVMEKGRIREQGTHDELMRLNGVYKALHDVQFAADEASVAE